MMNLIRHMKDATGHKRGFTLLIAVVVASLMLILAASISSLVQKEVVLSSIGRDSQYAFYAADSALECTLYWDFQKAAFGPTQSSQSVVCDGQTIAAEPGSGTTVSGGVVTFPGYGTPMEFYYETSDPVTGAKYCAKVSITKEPKDTKGPKTYVQAHGYNVACAVVDAGSSDRALERAVAAKY